MHIYIYIYAHTVYMLTHTRTQRINAQVNRRSILQIWIPRFYARTDACRGGIPRHVAHCFVVLCRFNCQHPATVPEETCETVAACTYTADFTSHANTHDAQVRVLDDNVSVCTPTAS